MCILIPLHIPTLVFSIFPFTGQFITYLTYDWEGVFSVTLDKKLLIGCPKLDDANKYTDKLSKTLESSKNLESKEEGTKITIAYMEVPCCQGIKKIVNDAIEKSGVDVPVESVVIGMDGEIRI